MLAADLTLFAHVATRPEPELDLAMSTLLIAEPEYPALDIPHYLERLDELGAMARTELGERQVDAEPPLRRVTRLLHNQLGFRGNHEDYYDPRNSYLNEVLDRRIGIPITLAVVILEVARRAGIQAQGVGFPGHFLVRTAGPIAPLFIDPFDGTLAGPSELRALLARAGGDAREPDPRLLEPITKRHLLARILNNLRGIFASRGDRERLRFVLERIQVLAPSDETEQLLVELGGGSPPAPLRGRIIN